MSDPTTAPRIADNAGEPEQAIDVTECPECSETGRYDGRVLIGGRGIYTCPNGHRWQDANETPTNKGIPIVGNVPYPGQPNYPGRRL